MMSDKNVKKPELAEGTGERGMGAHTTKDEMELAKLKAHDIDNAKQIAFLYKVIDKKYKKGEPRYRINWYRFANIYDKGIPALMLKYELEGFIKGLSMGTRPMKLYLSVDMGKEIEGAMDKIPKKPFIDTRTKDTMERPNKIVKQRTTIERELDIDDPFGIKKAEKKEEEKDIDPYDID